MRTGVVFILVVILVALLLAGSLPASVSGWYAASESTGLQMPGTTAAPQAQSPSGASRALQECPWDPFEDNNSLGSAFLLSEPGDWLDAYICPEGDADFFKFWVISGQEITVFLDNPPEAYCLRLYDPDEALRASALGDNVAPREVTYTADKSGYWYAEAFGAHDVAWSEEPYYLRVALGEPPAPTATATATGVSCPADSYEPNGGFGSAALIAGGEPHAAYICPEGDEDYFRFWVISGQGITVQLYNLPASYDLELYDANQAKRISSYGTTTDPREVSFTADVTGYWYARVLGSYAGQWSTTAYTLLLTLGEIPAATATPTATLSRTPTRTATALPTATRTATRTPTATATQTPTSVPTATWTATRTPTTVPAATWTATRTATTVPTATATATQLPSRTPTHTLAPTPTATPTVPVTQDEPNDTFEQATLLFPDQVVLSYIWPASDLDNFRFYVQFGQEIQANLYNMSYDADLELYDPSETMIGLSANIGVTPEELRVTAEDTGWFYARVFGTQDGLANPYNLLVTLTGQPTPTATATPLYPNCPDGFEPNNWCGPDKPAWELTTSGFWSYICAADDVDYWRIPSVAVSQTIDIALDRGEHDYYLKLYNPQCGLEAESYGWLGDVVRLRHTADTAGTWYVQVYGASGDYSTTDLYHITAGVYDCTRDRLEPNDESIEAEALGLPTSPWSASGLSICPPGEQDWFFALTSEGATLLADLSHDPNQGALRMCLYEPAVFTPTLCTDPDLGLNRIDYQSPDSLGRYLAVEAATPGGTNPNYGLTVQVRLPTPTPTSVPTVVVPDFTVQGIEITQVTQRYPANDVPLVAGKTTGVRVYITTTAGSQAVSARLRVVGGDPPGSVYLYPVNSLAEIEVGSNPRANLKRSANFVLPSDYTVRGSLLIEAEVNYDHQVLETDYTNNKATRTVTFNQREWLTVVFVRVRYYQQPDPNYPPVRMVPECLPWEGARGSAYTVSVFPVSSVNIQVPATGDVIEFYGDLSTLAGWQKLLDQVDNMARHSTAFGGLVKWYALLPNLTAAQRRGLWGMAKMPGLAGVGYGGISLAHELGHMFGRLHAPCLTWEYVDPNYPDPNGGIQEFGLDPAWMQLWDPAMTTDFMGNCIGQWASPYTYEALYTAIGPRRYASGLSVVASDQQDYLLLGIELDSEAGTGQLDGAFVDARPVGTDDDPGSGPYAIELQDAAGSVLFTRYFGPATLDSSGSSTPAVSRWLEMLPFPPETQRVLLRHEGQELDRRERSAHAPAVAVEYPNGGEALDGEFEVRWNGSDADGDDLVYTLQFSIDGGQSWTAAATGLTATRYTMDGAQMAGTTAGKVRVLASDGLNTTADESDAVFSVPKKPPQAYIIAPQDGDAFAVSDVIILRGAAFDREDGSLSGELLTWTSDQHGVLGTGEEVAAPAFEPGWHDVVFTAHDSDGNVAEDTIRLYVGSRVYLPVVIK